jgi:hypothetical protein
MMGDERVRSDLEGGEGDKQPETHSDEVTDLDVTPEDANTITGGNIPGDVTQTGHEKWIE